MKIAELLPLKCTHLPLIELQFNSALCNTVNNVVWTGEGGGERSGPRGTRDWSFLFLFSPVFS